MKLPSWLPKLSIYTLSAIINRISPILLTPLYTRVFSVQHYGLVDLYLTINMMVFIFFETQVVSGFMREYHDYKSKGTLSCLFSGAISYYLMSNLFLWFVFGVGLISFNIPVLYIHLMLAIMFGLFPAQFMGLFLVLVRMQGRSMVFLTLNSLQVLMSLFCGVLFVVKLHWGILGAVWAFVTPNIILLPVLALLSMPLIQKIEVRPAIKKMLWYGVPIVPAVLGGWLMNYSSRFFVMHFMGLYALGIYSLIFRVGALILLFLDSFRLVWGPYVMKLYTLEVEHAKAIFSKVLDFYFLFGVGVILFLSFLLPLLVRLFAPHNYWGAYYYADFILLAFLWNGAFTIFSVGCAWVRKTYFNTLSTFVGLAVNMLGAFIFIHRFHLFAVCTFTMLGFLVNALVAYGLSQRQIRIQYSRLTLIWPIIFSFSYVSSIYGLKHFNMLNLRNFYAVKGLFVLYFMIIVFLYLKKHYDKKGFWINKWVKHGV